MTGHPYSGQPDRAFWRRAVSSAGPGGLDPVTRVGFRIGPSTRVASLGSCFSQHLTRHLAAQGVALFDTEPAPVGLAPDEALRRNYGVFSVRAGNVYTVRQALQLVDRAFGRFQPREPAWRREARVVDPFRPTIEPDGFDDVAAMEHDREQHLARVRELFERAEVLVFTLGITEAWCSAEDGAVFPLAPGVAGGSLSPDRHRFVRFGFAETASDLASFRDRLLAVNPGLRLVLTVSPVPLAATFTDEHVCVASMQSKSVLRAAVGELSAMDERVSYFPSYEVVAGFGTPRSYYADDLRHVTEAGVRHVMRVFVGNYMQDSRPASAPLEAGLHAEAVCDEDLLDARTAGATPSRRSWLARLRRSFGWRWHRPSSTRSRRPD